MASVFKPKGAKKYVIQYTDDQGRRRKQVGATDKGVTQRIARDLENKVALRREGLVDLKAETYRDHEARPLSAHLEDFRLAVVAKRSRLKHAQTTRNRALAVFDRAKLARVSELSVSRVHDGLAKLRAEKDLSQETINHHARAVKTFARWLWKEGRARDHHLAHLATANSAADRRRVRRDLTHEEAARLIQAAASGPTVKGMSGPDRATCYMVALGTGFRANEMRHLTPERINLDAATATVPAAYTKNGHEAVQLLSPALVARLRPYLATRPEGQPIFALPDRTAEMLRVDLKAAGIAYKTAEGVADFHSLRGVYISNLVASGASVKTCQTLARHSTPSITIGIYAKASLHDLKGAVAALPDLTPLNLPPEVLAATGTEGRQKPPATGFATGPDDTQPQTLSLYGGCENPSLDLKSSGGLPPCGFESHRRHLDRLDRKF